MCNHYLRDCRILQSDQIQQKHMNMLMILHTVIFDPHFRCKLVSEFSCRSEEIHSYKENNIDDLKNMHCLTIGLSCLKIMVMVLHMIYNIKVKIA